MTCAAPGNIHIQHIVDRFPHARAFNSAQLFTVFESARRGLPNGTVLRSCGSGPGHERRRQKLARDDFCNINIVGSAVTAASTLSVAGLMAGQTWLMAR